MVELIGGVDAARQLVLEAIAHGKHVVTANKALLALHGDEVFKAAAAMSVSVRYEASIAGGISNNQGIKGRTGWESHRWRPGLSTVQATLF